MVFDCPRCGGVFWQPNRDALRLVEQRADAMIDRGQGEAAMIYASEEVRRIAGVRMPISPSSSVEKRAIRAIADTSRYDASVEERELDAQCALAALKADGIDFISRVDYERLLEFCNSRAEAIEQISPNERRLKRIVMRVLEQGVTTDNGYLKCKLCRSCEDRHPNRGKLLHEDGCVMATLRREATLPVSARGEDSNAL